jgi:hypothetical protein
MIWPFSLLKPRIPRDPRINHDFTLADSDMGNMVIRSNAEVKKAKNDLEIAKIKLEAERDRLQIQSEIEEYKQKLEDLQDYDDDEPEEGGDSTDKMLMALIAGALGQKQPQGAPISPQAPITPTPDGEPSDQELREIWRKLPQQYKDQVRSLQ